MFSQSFLVFLLAHMIGDFYFQSAKMSEQKAKEVKSFLSHCIWYTLGGFVVCLAFWNRKLILPLIIFSLSHALIDLVKVLVQKKLKNREHSSIVFILDQFFHLLIITLISILIAHNNIDIVALPMIENALSYTGLNLMFCVKFLIIFLGNFRPCNIIIKNTIKTFKPEFLEAERKIGAGSIIGTFERYIITMFLAIQEYSLIGLVLTAKSIARYSQLNNDKKLAEYYLLGTLMSTFYSMALYLMVVNI